jgi:sugar transferase EpsL
MLLEYNQPVPPDVLPVRIPYSKRIFDLMLTIPGLICLLPVLGLISLVIWMAEGRPILFLQERPGFRGRIFKIIKFRTMRILRDDQGKWLPDGERLSPLGRLLRSTSLDELPELINVLRGEMSLVGPRPLLVAYLERYNAEQARRHDVLPGMTGWAQVNGRNLLDWEEKFRLDVWYVDHWSLWLDVKILFLTILKAFQREGINKPGHATSEEFMGESSHRSEPDKPTN